eukprot:11664328-Karenia_brevis.AAC.1
MLQFLMLSERPTLAPRGARVIEDSSKVFQDSCKMVQPLPRIAKTLFQDGPRGCRNHVLRGDLARHCRSETSE